MGSVEPLPGGKPLYEPPRSIMADDGIERFDCGKPALNTWLHHRAHKNEGRASRTYVVTSAGEVAGFYSLSAGSVELGDVPSKLRRNMPNPLPVMVLGRMAVDLRHAGKGLGRGMLRDALQRSLEAARAIGVRAILVHAIDDDAVTFYTRFDFQVFPNGSRTLFLPIESVAQALP